MIYVALVVLRSFLAVVCVETSIRYSVWWRKVRREDPRTVLSTLLLGIAAAQGGIALQHVVALFNDYQPPPLPWATIAADVLMMVGTLYHLFPAWRISHGYNDRRIATALFVRALIAAALAIVVFALDAWGMARA